jgi:hypothetical protein
MCVLCAVVGATENDAPFDPSCTLYHFTKSKHLISMARLTVVTFRFPLPYGSQDCYYINLNIFSICQTAAMEIPHQFLNQSVTAASAVSLCNASDFRPRTRRPYPHPTAQPPIRRPGGAPRRVIYTEARQLLVFVSPLLLTPDFW